MQHGTAKLIDQFTIDYGIINATPFPLWRGNKIVIPIGIALAIPSFGRIRFSTGIW